jgi:hypothetical protein
MKTAFIGAILTLLFGACQSPVSVEQRLMGTWAKPTTRFLSGRDRTSGYRNMVGDVIEVSFTADHKETWRYRGTKRHAAAARWHLDGSDLVFTLESQAGDAPAGTTRREKIKRVTSDQLVFTEDGHDTVWTRVR